MKKRSYLKIACKHFRTITHHRHLVMSNCFKCGLYKQGLLHDLSKYSPAEFLESVKYYQGYRSPYTYEKELFGYAPGWLHHKGRNKHHWEYWYDVLDGQLQPIEMPLPYFVEMVCDRVAACKNYEKEQYTNRSALEYFLTRKEKDFMHEKTRDRLYSVLRQIAEVGEEAVFADLKKQVKAYKKNDRG